MPYQPIAGTAGAARLMLFDMGDGHIWGENLMKLTNAVRAGNLIIDEGFSRQFA